MSGRGSPLGRVEQALRAAGVGPGERLLVAVSGGPDSMVLLDLVSRLRERLGLRLLVVHVHHGLRGTAADRDAALVVAAAAARGLGVTVARLAPAGRRRGESLQMWARDARYRALEEVREAVQAGRILTAHTEDDQAETLLLHLLRGTGPVGLTGIPAARGPVLRPLLSVSRAEVEAYARARAIAFRRDASNRSEAYLRNRVRRRLLPRLCREYNPRLTESLAGLAALLREDEAALAVQAAALMRQAVFQDGDTTRVAAGVLRQAPPALRRRVLAEAFRRAAGGRPGLTRRHLEALLRLLEGGGRVLLPGGCAASRVGDELRLGPARPAPPAPAAAAEVPLRPGVWTAWGPGGCRLRVRRVAAPGRIPRRGGRTEVLTPRLLAEPLSVRGWRAGDRFRPLGLAGQKKLQDFFVDEKIPRTGRGRVPLLLAGGRIAWVVGHRIAEDFRWEGRGPGCLVEVRYDGGRDALRDRADAD
ncbi:MAG: tRNA lysidine(34) synthetase TilS [Candidatus Methylomirabilales bacterium]